MTCSATPTQVQAQCAGLGIPTCVCQAYCAANGVLAPDVPTLDAWGDATGLRNPASGAWSCTPTGGGGPPPPAGACPSGQIGILGKCYAEGTVLAVGAVGLLFLLRRKRR